MKKFKNLFEADAKDYVQKDDDEQEVLGYKLRSKGEQDFANLHTVDKKKHPTAPDEQHDGERPKGKKGKAGMDSKGPSEKGDELPMTYAKFMKLGGFGTDSYKGAGNSAGEKALVMQGSSKVSEEVEYIDEAFKKGMLKLKDGKTVKVDEATAKMLNNALKKLNPGNRKKMETEAVKNKKSFDDMVKFAKIAA